MAGNHFVNIFFWPKAIKNTFFHFSEGVLSGVQSTPRLIFLEIKRNLFAANPKDKMQRIEKIICSSIIYPFFFKGNCFTLDF